jgi:sterol desaturase/sphingolipid hydroxylase (fatty acid hydroxylase superfamily)
MAVLYDRHTPLHHRIFVEGDMAVRSRREWRLVLIPAYGVVLIILANLPAVVALTLLGQRNLAALYAMTSVAYVLSYEWLHLAYHLPEGHPIARLRFVAALARHHAKHHDPALMQRWNFNVTFPIWDRVRGTTYRE